MRAERYVQAMAEDPKRQVDRELKELLEELRIIVPGVQLLGGFLLAVAFQSRFKEISSFEKGLYFLAFVTASFATILLLAPPAQHRLLWRHPKKETFLKTASVLTFLGSISLAISLVSVAYLIGSVVYGGGIALATAVGFGVLTVLVWYAVPLAELISAPQGEDSEVAEGEQRSGEGHPDRRQGAQG